MPAPASYTEQTLAQYMHTIITNDDKVTELVTTLLWNVANGSYEEAVNEAMLVMGVSDVTSLTSLESIRQLRAVARMELWRLVVQRTVASIQVSDGVTAVSRQQIWEHAKAMLEMATAEAVSLGVVVNAAYQVGKTAVRHTADFYRYGESTDNEWSRVN